MKILKRGPQRLDYINPHMVVNYTKVNFDGFNKEYFVVDLGPRAGVVAIRDDCVLMTRQYRFLIDTMSWEIPGGKVDAGETPEQAAARECLEETGVQCRNFKLLTVYYPGLDNFDNQTSVFYSEDVTTVTPFVANPAEITEFAWLPLNKCMEMAFNGEIMDALTITGLLAYQCKIRNPHIG
jgi:8-oxo-dGTP pyrophosphatase MutT (NUDIX family)